MEQKAKDLSVIVALIVAAAFVTLTLHPKLLVSAFLFFGVPALYLHMLDRFQFNYRKLTAAVLALGISGAAVDIVMRANLGWQLPASQMLILPDLFGFWSLDNTLWMFMFVFFLVSFYEYFLDDERHRALSPQFRKFIWFPIVLTAGAILFSLFAPESLIGPIIPYPYLVLGLFITLVPLVLLALQRDRRRVIRLFGKFTLAAGFFFFVNLIYELTGLATGQWLFPGEYVGSVYLAGFFIPFEEFLFYIVLSTFSLLGYYELFVDDTR